MRHIKPAFCRFDPAHLFDGLFVPTKGKKRGRLYVPPRKFGDLEISFQGFEQLGADDQSLLLAISAQLGIDGLLIQEGSGGEISRQLWLDLQLQGETERATARTRKTTLRSLLTDAGYKSAGSTRDAKAILNRLANAQVREVNKRTGWDRRCNIISTHFNTLTGETFIAANPRLAGVLFQGQHIRVSLHERRELETEQAKLLHCWLCSYVQLGKSLGNGNGAKVENLIHHVYGPGETSRKTASVRRGKIRDALDEIRDKTAGLHRPGEGWAIDHQGGGLVTVSRPKKIPMSEAMTEAAQRIIEKSKE